MHKRTCVISRNTIPKALTVRKTWDLFYNVDQDLIIDDKKKLMLYRIVQEQLTYIRKYTHAQKAIREVISDGKMNISMSMVFIILQPNTLLKVPFINNNLNSLLDVSQKMSKSRNNSIMIKSTEDETNKLIKSGKN